MRRHPVAGTYARAMLEVALERGSAVECEKELQAISDLLKHAEFKVFLENPKIPRGSKVEIFSKVLQGKISDAVLNFMTSIIRRGREIIFSEICVAYSEALDENRGRVHVTLTSATALSEGTRTAFVNALAKKLGREIIAAEKVDADLLGGVTVRIGDTVIDGSIRAKLNAIQDSLLAPRIGSEQIK